MTPFEVFASSIVAATYFVADETNPLGIMQDEGTPVNVLVDEDTSTKMTMSPTQQTDDILFYAQDSPLDSHKCIGNYLQIVSTVTFELRTFKIDTWNVAKNQETGEINHYEIAGQEVGS